MTTRNTTDLPEHSALSAADLRGILGVVREWYEAPTLEALMRATVLGVARLVGCDASGWNEIDFSTGRVEFFTDPFEYVTPDQAETLRQLIDRHPVVERLGSSDDGAAVTLSELLTAREYHEHPLYTDVYRALRVEDQMTFTIQAGNHAIGIALNRDRRGFAARDRAVLNALRPHLQAAHASVTARLVAVDRLAAFERGLDRAGRWVAVVRGGRIQAAGDATRQVLERWFGPDGTPLPAPGESLQFDRDDASLVVRLAPGDPPVLLIDEIRHTPDPDRVRALGLSAREAEVIALAQRGLGDGEIADALTIALRTVHKHLENAYRKLGVRTRRDAADRLFDR